jgi:hypothetical protein
MDSSPHANLLERYSSTTAVVDLHPHVCVYTPTGPTKFSTTTKFSIMYSWYLGSIPGSTMLHGVHSSSV